jgi:hypothetical protein
MEFFNTYQTITGIILIPLWGFTIYYFIKETLKFANPHIKSALKWLVTSGLLFVIAVIIFQLINFITPQSPTSFLWTIQKAFGFLASILLLISVKKLKNFVLPKPTTNFLLLISGKLKKYKKNRFS